MINYLKENLEKADLNQCQRLFHGRGHFYPELDFVNVDWFSPVVLIVLYRECEESQLAAWVNRYVDRNASTRHLSYGVFRRGKYQRSPFRPQPGCSVQLWQLWDGSDGNILASA